MATLSEILQDSSSYLDLDSTLPTGTELTTRIRFANMALSEWGGSSKWRQLKTEAEGYLGAYDSIEIPNFQYLSGPVVEQIADGIYQEYPEIRPEDRYSKDSSEKYCYIMGSQSTGFFLYPNGLATNATLSIPYVRSPSAMATLTDVCEVPDPNFVTQRIISYVLQARNDERFPIVMSEGNRLLRNMVSAEQLALPGGSYSTPKKGVAAYSIGG